MMTTMGVRRFVALALVALMFLAACSSDSDDGDTAAEEPAAEEQAAEEPAAEEPAEEPAAEEPAEEPADEEVQIAHFVVIQANPYEQAHIDEVAITAEELGGSITLFDAATDPVAQEAQCRDAITSQQYDVFLLKAVAGPTMVSCTEDAIAAGIIVVAVDTPIGPDLTTEEAQVEGLSGSVVAIPESYAEPRAEATKAACEGIDECKVIYLFAAPVFTFAAEAREVFLSIIDGEDNIEIVAEGTTFFSPDEGYAQTKELLQVHPDTHVIVSDSDPGALGAWQAMEELEVTDTILLVGDGAALEAIEFLKSGDWFASPPNFPRSMGRLATEIAMAVARGEDPGDAFVSTKAEFGADYSNGLFTPEQLEVFVPEWQLTAG